MDFIRNRFVVVNLLMVALMLNLVILPITMDFSFAQDAETENYESICQKAEQDAIEDEDSSASFAFGGFMCGVFGYIFAATSKPEPPVERLVGKDEDYAHAYATCYRQKAKSLRTKAACIGWAVGSTVSMVYFMATTESN